MNNEYFHKYQLIFPFFLIPINHFPQRLADLQWAGFLPQMLMRRTELSPTIKLSEEHETLPIANELLWADFFTGLTVRIFN
jgi:hypothetical protein